MKKFAQTAVLIAGLAGLSACASNDVWTPYGTRTAGDGVKASAMSAPATMSATKGQMDELRMCRERENRLLAMNKSCYRK